MKWFALSNFKSSIEQVQKKCSLLDQVKKELHAFIFSTL